MSSTLVKNLRSDHVSEIRMRPICTASPATPVRDVLDCMVERRAGSVLVLEGGRLVGIFTERDFVNRVVAQGLDASLPIERVMTPAPQSVATDDAVLAAIERMATGGFRHVPVVDGNGEPVGVLSVRDIVHYLVEYFPAKVYNLPPSPELYQTVREGA